jgi:hypothetical protein
VCAFSCVGTRDGLANALTGTRHDGDATFQGPTQGDSPAVDECLSVY